MSYQVRRILIIAALSALAFAGLYTFTGEIYRDKIELTIYTKVFRNTELRLYYSEGASLYDQARSELQDLKAMQFMKPVSFTIPGDVRDVRFHLDLGEVSNEVFIEKVELCRRSQSVRTVIADWTGENIQSLIGSYNDVSVAAKSGMRIQLSAGSADPYLEFNDTITKRLAEYDKHHDRGKIWQLIASIVLTIFVATILGYFLPRKSSARIARFIQNGGILIGGATAIIACVFINNHFHFVGDRENVENRVLAAQPNLGLENFFDYPDQYTAYAKDNFSFRNYLFYLHSRYMAGVFHESPLPDNSMIGKNDWLFETEPGVVGDYRRITQISELELAQVAKNMYEKKKWLTDRGIRFYVIVAPNKHGIYSELLPRGYFPSKGISESRLVVYREHLARYTDVELIDPTEALLRAKNKREVYYRSDTHWNLYGGYIGYRELMKRICRDFPLLKPAEEDDFNFTSYNNSIGDLAKEMGLGDQIQRQEIMMTFKDTAKQLRFSTTSQMVIDFDSNKTIDGSHLKLVMLRDSYANYLLPFLNLHFQKAKYIWAYDFPDKIIEQEKPDVVIFESLQRFMYSACTVPNPESLDTTKQKPLR